MNLLGNPPDVLKTIADRRTLEPVGEPSLQNALDIARTSMMLVNTSKVEQTLTER